MSKPQSRESTSQLKPSTYQRMLEANDPPTYAQMNEHQLQGADSSESNTVGQAPDYQTGSPQKSLVKACGDDQHFVELSNEEQYGQQDTLEVQNKKASSEDRSSQKNKPQKRYWTEQEVGRVYQFASQTPMLGRNEVSLLARNY